jgi:RIP metalloprotease RseP
MTFEKEGTKKEAVFPPSFKEDKKGNFQLGVAAGGPVISAIHPSRTDLNAFKVGDIIRAVSAPDSTPIRVLGRDLEQALGEGVSIYSDEAPETFSSTEVSFLVSRDGAPFVIVMKLPTRESRLNLLRFLALNSEELCIWVNRGGAAAEAGLETGDVLLSVNGKKLTRFRDLIDATDDSDDNTMKFEVDRFGEKLSFVVKPKRTPKNFTIPITKSEVPLYEVKEPLGEAFQVGVLQTGRMVKRVMMTLGSLFKGSVSPKNLGGIITIFDQSKKHAEFFGLMRWLLFLAMVSINLAVLNILPIPVLDGGWLMFLLIEKITGRPPSQRVIGVAQWAGLILVLGLMVFVTWNDIARLIRAN